MFGVFIYVRLPLAKKKKTTCVRPLLAMVPPHCPRIGKFIFSFMDVNTNWLETWQRFGGCRTHALDNLRKMLEDEV